MSVLGDLAKGIRDMMVLSERVDQAIVLGKEADRRSLENRERIVRLETILEIAIRQASGQPQLPPGH